MPTLICTRGLPGSGKTYWAREQVAQSGGKLVRLNRDDFRTMMGSGATGEIEREVTAAQHAAVEALLRAGKNVVVDDTNLNTNNLRRLAAVGWKCGADVHVEDFTTPLEECLRRDAERPRPVGEKVIRDMHSRYLSSRTQRPVIERPQVTPGAVYVPDPELPGVVMVDIDGTVALHGTRNPYDTSRYHEDTPNTNVIAAIRCMSAAGYGVVYCSGRDAKFREVTETWLAENVQIPGRLFMRPEGDTRRDDIVKLELFDAHIRNSFNVALVYDDRDRVVAAWRSIGLTVCQVADGAF